MNTRRVFWLYLSLTLFALAHGCVSGKREMTKDPAFSMNTLKINAKANIFRAGGGDADTNGGGLAAPSVTFDAQAGNVLTFSEVSGTVSCCGGGDEFNDADGGTFAGGVTDVESSGGISGITHHEQALA